jgi:hypothetical protein
MPTIPRSPPDDPRHPARRSAIVTPTIADHHADDRGSPRRRSRITTPTISDHQAKISNPPPDDPRSPAKHPGSMPRRGSMVLVENVEGSGMASSARPA